MASEHPSTDGVTADQVRQAVADLASLPLGIGMAQWCQISNTLLAAARKIESSPEPGSLQAGHDSYKRMFEAAVLSLAELSVALEIPPEVAECANGNAEMLDAIAALKARSPEPAERPKDGDPYVGPEPILLGIGKIRVAICSDTDDPKHVARELVIYDDGEGPKPVGTPEPEHAGKRADQVGKVLARLRVVNAKGAMIFASDLMTVIENAARADYGSSETKGADHGL